MVDDAEVVGDEQVRHAEVVLEIDVGGGKVRRSHAFFVVRPPAAEPGSEFELLADEAGAPGVGAVLRTDLREHLTRVA